MTNYENFMNMNIKEFAITRINWDEQLKMYTNDTINSYYEGEIEEAIKDEIGWLNQKVTKEEEYHTQDELSTIWHGFGRSE